MPTAGLTQTLRMRTSALARATITEVLGHFLDRANDSAHFRVRLGGCAISMAWHRRSLASQLVEQKVHKVCVRRVQTRLVARLEQSGNGQLLGDLSRCAGQLLRVGLRGVNFQFERP